MNPRIIIASLAIAFYAALQFTGGVATAPLFFSLLFLMFPVMFHVHTKTPWPQTVEITSTGGLLALYSLWIVISIPFSTVPGTSVQVGASLLVMPLGFLALSCSRADQEIWPQTLLFVRAISLVVLWTGIVEFLLLRNRPSSFFLDTNLFAAFCNVLLLPLVPALLQRKQSGRSWKEVFSSGSGLLFISALLCLAMTRSLAGTISFVLSCLILIGLLSRRSGFAYALSAWVASLFILMRILVYLLTRLTRHPAFHDVINQSFGDRIRMLKSACSLYVQHPFLGIGIGTYKVLYPAVRSPQEISSSGNLLHNDYAQFLLEGGPLLAILLTTLAVFSVRWIALLWRSSSSSIEEQPYYEAAGLGCALLALFIHAIPNFIFYSLPMSLLAGLYLARLEALAPLKSARWHMRLSRGTARGLSYSAIILLTGTLGLQAVFIELTTAKCTMRMCDRLSNDNRFILKYASLLAATQPSYLPARNRLIDTFVASAKEAEDASHAEEAARLAVHELSDVIAHSPAVAYPYRVLSSLLQSYPNIQSAIPAGVPNDATELLRVAVLKDPLDTTARLELALLLERAGHPAEAFSLIVDDGLRWWNVNLLGISAKVDMLHYAIPLALRINHCPDALELVRRLLVIDPNDEEAKRVQSALLEQNNNKEPKSNCIAEIPSASGS